MGFFGHLFSFFRRKSLPERIEDQLEERRLRPRVNPKESTRVLVIDDSPTILTAMKRFLESAHCVFLGALDAKMGMEVALTQKPDLIFLDIVMPGINGFAALRALRKNARTREIPIIMMSGNEQAKAQFFGAHIGADDFMKKPFSRFEVFARIARLLDVDRIPRRLPPHQANAPEQEVQPTAAAPTSTEEVVPPPSPPPRARPRAEARVPPPKQAAAPVATPAPVVAPPPAAPSEPPPLLTTVQIEEQPSSPVAQPQAPAVVQTPPPPPAPVSAQVVPIAPTPAPAVSAPGVSPELLARIARLAQLAQSDPEALKALVVLSAQLAAQYTAAISVASQEQTAVQALATAS